MSAVEANAFRANPHFEAAVALRRWDDEAKIPNLVTPPLDHFIAHVEQAARNSNPSIEERG